MQIDDYFSRVAILGAAGKMGSGISLLVIQEVARLQAQNRRPYQVVCIDTATERLDELRKYLKAQLTKYAERSIIQLREWYANNPALIDNGDIIEAFVDTSLARVQFTSSWEDVRGATLVFEAVVEKVNVKTEVLRACQPLVSPKAIFLTNTSSIPIHELDAKANLKGRIVGFHFYNPPAVQRLLEIIKPVDVDAQSYNVAREIAHRFHKTLVESADIAGFIGNGHFIRELIHACKKAQESSATTEGIVLLDTITREFLIRPMGIFQLADYVGLDVVVLITQVMHTYLHEDKLTLPLIEKYLSQGLIGGQNADGSQRHGIFKYEKGVPVGVYNLETKNYEPLAKSDLGPLPAGYLVWKYALRDPESSDKVDTYLTNLFQAQTPGALLAKDYLLASCKIGQNLVRSGVAQNLDDVDKVLKLGFFHLYGIRELEALQKTSLAGRT